MPLKDKKSSVFIIKKRSAKIIILVILIYLVDDIPIDIYIYPFIKEWLLGLTSEWQTLHFGKLVLQQPMPLKFFFSNDYNQEGYEKLWDWGGSHQTMLSTQLLQQMQTHTHTSTY